MTLNELRVGLVQGFSLIAALVTFIATLRLMFTIPGYLGIAIIIFGVVLTAYLATMAFTIRGVTYPQDHIFALFVMTEVERQRFFCHGEKHPEYRKNFGIYRLTGYKLKALE